jgi:hypothetical protein
VAGVAVSHCAWMRLVTLQQCSAEEDFSENQGISGQRRLTAVPFRASIEAPETDRFFL